MDWIFGFACVYVDIMWQPKTAWRRSMWNASPTWTCFTYGNTEGGLDRHVFALTLTLRHAASIFVDEKENECEARCHHPWKEVTVFWKILQNTWKEWECHSFNSLMFAGAQEFWKSFWFPSNPWERLKSTSWSQWGWGEGNRDSANPFCKAG